MQSTSLADILDDLNNFELRFLILLAQKGKNKPTHEYVLLTHLLDYENKGIERLHSYNLIEIGPYQCGTKGYDHFEIEPWEIEEKGLNLIELAEARGINTADLALPSSITSKEFSKVFHHNNPDLGSTLKNAWYKRIVKPNDTRIYNHGPFDSEAEAKRGFQLNNIIEFMH